MASFPLRPLPELPQRQKLLVLAHALWRAKSVVAVWLGGSLARGTGDAYSDIDLRVGVRPDRLNTWESPDFASLFASAVLAHLRFSFEQDTFLHHLMLTDGSIVDLLVQSSRKAPYSEPVIVLGCRDEILMRRLSNVHPGAEPEPPWAEGDVILELLVQFWINTHKHRKVLHRGLDLLAVTGIQAERALLQRLWHVLATGRDFGSGRQETIHGLSNFTRTVMHARGVMALEIAGGPLTNRSEIVQAIEQLRDAVADAGTVLAERLGFDYPDTLEQQVRRDWAVYIGH